MDPFSQFLSEIASSPLDPAVRTFLDRLIPLLQDPALTNKERLAKLEAIIRYLQSDDCGDRPNML